VKTPSTNTCSDNSPPLKKGSEELAIIGMACRFPDANHYHEFWQNLVQGVNSIREIPPERWDIDQYYSPLIDEQNKSISKWCGLLDNIDQFDNRFFSISPREAKNMDPQQRLLLEETWHCLEDSGVALKTLQEKKTAVYVGVMARDFFVDACSPDVVTDSYAALGVYDCILANRISYTFGLRGASLSIDAACASSLVALHHAKTALLSGECDYALVAGVSLDFRPWKYISFSKSRMLSPEGQCKTFDKDANGYVPGEGVGVVLLQPLKVAQRARNQIYGVIKGSAVNHGGQTPSITAPRVEAQRDVILAAYQDAGISPDTVTYVEAHGTGTSLGDPIEVEALTRAFREYTAERHFCEIGSVKTNIGHLEAAAGMAGIIKVLLMMRHQQIPPTLNINTLNPVINFAESPFLVATDLQEWPTQQADLPHRAGISSFGFGGANAHVVLESFSPETATPSSLSNPENTSGYLFILSGKSANALNKTLEQWKAFVNSKAFSEYHLRDISATVMTTRSDFAYRYGGYVENKAALKALIEKETPSFSKVQNEEEWCLRVGDLAWQNIAEVQPLLDQEPLFKQHLEEVEHCLSNLEVVPRVIKEGFYRSDWLMPPLYSFMVNYAYLSTLITLGFTPRLIMGQQSGLWLSLTLSGMIKLEDALAVLSTQKDVQQLEFAAAPQIPFYDPVSQQTIRPVHFDENTLHALVDNLNIATTDLHHFVERAQLLKDNQFTFKKYLEEWDRILRQQTGKTLDALLTDDVLLHSEPDAYQKEKILLTLIIKSTLRQLDQKWDLTRSQRITDPKFQALLDLLMKGVMPKEDVIALFLQPQPDWAALAARLNERQAKLDISQQNPFIKTQALPFKGHHEVTEWFKSAMILESPYPTMSENRAYLDFGISPEQVVSEPQNQIAITDNQTETFKKTLLSLWLYGVDLKTDRLFPEGSFNKVSLPTYGFDRKAFWLTTENELASQKSVTKSPLEGLKNNRLPSAYPPTPPHTESQPLISPFASHQVDELRAPLVVQKASQQTIPTHEEQKKMTHSNLKDDNVSNSSDHDNQITPSSDKVFLSEQDTCMLLKKTTQDLKDIVAKVLHCKANDIDNQADLISEYGIDSLANIEILDHLENVFGHLSTTLLSDYPTIEQLTKYFIQSFPQELAKQFGLNQKAAHKTPEKIVPKPIFPTSPKPIPADKKTVAKKAISHPPLENQHKDIAIIGLSGRFPMSSDVNQLWAHLIKGESCTKEVPPERWDYRQYYDENGNDPNKSYTKWGGFLEDYDKFDPLFFNISPRQAELMDPQQRLVLESAWATLEDAGYTRASLSRNTGVFIGVTTNTYSWLAMEASLNGNIHCPDTDNYDIANRISYFCDFNGPSLSVDTACSSSLTAIHLAVESLHRDECKTAIVGGINLTQHPHRILFYCRKNMLLAGKDCHPFGDGRGGFVDAEGVATVLLKSFSQAVADGDHIYALIKATAINADGKTNGYTVPNPKLQSKLITTALKKAQINPRTISYVETHGTGTKTGDPIEIEGLTEAFAQYTDDLQFCTIGSIKSNIGHLIAGSGVAGLTKVLLQLKHRTLVPSIHSSPPNPHIDFKKTPFVVQQKLAYWQRPKIAENGQLKEYPRRVGINSFGAGGANAHIILEEYNASKADIAECEDTPQIIVLSAKNPERLQAYAKKIIDFVDNQFAKRVTAQKTVAARTIEPENLRITIEQDLLTWVSELLQVREIDIGLEEELSEYGLDAVGLTALTRRINEHYQLDITTALFSEHPSIAAVTQYLCDLYPKPTQTSGKKKTVFSAANHTTALSLGNMAYTLQVGREAMEERLAMVVSSLDEVKDKLTQYAQGQTEIEQFYRGHANADKAEPLLDGREGDAFLKIIIQDQKLSKLAQLWVSGVDIDWTLLSPHHKPQRISLPTYPFARERYWLPESTTRLPSQARGSQLHPFLESNTSTLQEQRYTTSLKGDEFFLADHVVGQQKTFPGVAYLEMAWVAGGMAGERAVQTLKDIVWVQPITVSDTPQRVHISFYPTEASQQVEFEVSTVDDDQQRQIHAQGQLTYQSQATTDAENLDLEAIQNRCPESWDQAKCYRLFQAVGLSYGPGFQSIQALYRNDTEALSRLVLPASLQSGFNDFVLHPTLMDGALQTVIGLMGSSTSGTPLPFALAEVSLIKPLPEQCFSYVTLTPESRDLNVKKFHLWFVDDRGQVLLKLKDFSVRVPRKIETTAKMYYKSVWEPQISPIQTQAQSISQVLLFERDETRYHALQARLGCEVIWVKPADRYQALGNQVYSINPAQAADYRQLLASLAQQHQFPSHIIHFWSQAPFVTDSTVLANQIDLSLYSVFHLSQALLAQHPKAPIQLLYLYLEPDNTPQPQYAALNGFAKTIRLENPKFIYKTVALSSLSEMNDSVLTEIQATDSFDIRYAHTQRWVKRWKAWETVQKSVPTTRLKEQGVYLVTGGAGGLGLIFAEYLAKQVQAKLVLTGRSATLNEQKAAKIQAIKALGAEVLYIQADVSQRDDVETMIAQTKTHFGQINGIIHSAGVLRDALLLNKTQDNMAAVLAPKILGSVYLDEATKNDKLDFFVLFSSIVAAMGNIGQSDYAYANSFMDNFAQWREGLRAQEQRFGQTLSINWPLWREGGMGVEQTEKWLTKNLGIQALSTATGLEAFQQGLAWHISQFMVIEGDAAKFESTPGFLGFEVQPQQPTRLSSLSSPTEDNKQLLEKFQQELVALACAIIKINPQNFEFNKYFNHYGFDSVNFTDFANQLNKKYQLEIAPTIFFEYTSIEALSQFLYNEYQERLVNYYYSEPSKTVSPTLQQTPITGVMAEPLEEIKSRFTEFVQANKGLMPSTKMPIAIIGMSGVMPQSDDLESFWQHLEAGDDLITEVPIERWDWQAYYGDSSVVANKTKAKWGGFMPHIDQFDSLFFGISPKEAELMDPQQRLFLETVWKTIEDAGYKASDLSGSNTGLFVGVASNDYHELLRQYRTKIEAHTSTGISHAVLANRVSYFLNLHGPSEPIDTACSSSLIAIHRAVEMIASGTCDMAIAGGVNVLLSPTLTLSFSKAGMLSEDGRCKTFDKRANGYVRSEGVGAILLKPLSQAQADGDHIYAIIKSTAENHGGQATSLTAPNPNAQTQLLIQAYKNADIDPSTISYIEAHGTGTSLGDPIEINGLKNAFTQLSKSKSSGQSLPTEPYCGLGSVKTNIGHLETAAGIAGVFKVLLSMQYQTLPATLHFEELNPHIQLQDSPFYIVKENRAWEALTDAKGQAIPRRAGISSFGFGGANAHIVLEEYDHLLPQTDFAKQGTQLIVLSAKNEDRLQAYAEKMLDFLEQQEKNEGNQNHANVFLANIAYTLQMGREAMAERLAIVVDNIESLTEKLMQYAQGQTEMAHFFRGNVKTSKAQNALLIEGEAGEAFLNMLIEKQELTKLAQLWILGIDIDWQLLYPKQHKPQRIALPTYPFARERYWIAKKETSFNREHEQIIQRIQSLPDEPTLNHLEAKSTLQSITKNHSLEAEIDDLKQLFSEALKLDIIHLDEHSMLEEFGVDSLVLMDIVQKISQRYHFKLKVSDIIGLNTITDLADYINFHSPTANTHTSKTEGYITKEFDPPKNNQKIKNADSFQSAPQSHQNEKLIENPKKTKDESLRNKRDIERERHFGTEQDSIPSLITTLVPQITLPHAETNSLLLLDQAFMELEQLGQYLLLDAFQRMGVFQHSGEKYNKDDLKRQLKIVPNYAPLYGALLDILNNTAFLQVTGQNIVTSSALDNPSLINELKYIEEYKHQLMTRFPDITAYVHLLFVCLNAYPEILTGQQDHKEILFPNGSLSVVEKIYKGNQIADYYNQRVADVVKHYLRQRLQHDSNAKIQILEVGAGTGGTSFFVMEAIKEYEAKIRYFYTDISFHFTQFGKKRYGAYPFIDFITLDIEQAPEKQGFEANSMDFIFASNVLHATKNINQTLNQVKKILKNNGLLLINELTRQADFVTLIFGLTKGWWLFEDEILRLPSSPLLSAKQWKAVLEKNGFRQVHLFSLPKTAIEQTLEQSIILGERDGDIRLENQKQILFSEEEQTPHFETTLNNHQKQHEKLLENYNYAFSSCDNLNIFKIKSLQGIQIEILSCGKGTPVVLLPALDCLATAWLYQILELSQQFQVLVFHYPGYGNSEFHDEQSHFEAIADSILDLLNLININQPFHLLGWSLGGFISQVMANKYAPHIKSLTLVNTTAKLEEDDSIENAFKLAKLLRDDFELHLPKEMRSKREGSIDFIKATDNNQISLHYIHQVLQFDFRSQIASIQIPTLVIAGGEDQITPPRYAEWIHNNIKGSKYEKLDKGGHYMPLQNAEYFNQHWFNFIQTKSF